MRPEDAERAVLPLFLADARVNRNRREIAFTQQLVQFRGADGALDKDDDLVELEVIKELVQLPVLLTLL